MDTSRGVQLKKEMGTSNPTLIGPASATEPLSTAKRQYRAPELKRKIVEESLAPGASVARLRGRMESMPTKCSPGGGSIGKGYCRL